MTGVQTCALPIWLNRDYHEIAAGYSENHRRNIRKASSQGVTYQIGHQPAEVVQLFRENRGQTLHHLKTKDYMRFLMLAETAITRNSAKVVTAHLSDGRVCAGAVFFESHQKAYFIFSGISNEGKAVSAMHGLVDFFISQNRERLSFLDFEGSNYSDLARFYSGFGSDEYLYLQVRRNTLPAPWKWFKK